MVLAICGIALAVLLGFVGLNWERVIVNYHMWRLQQDPEQLSVFLHAPAGSLKRMALEKFAVTPRGAERVLSETVLQLRKSYAEYSKAPRDWDDAFPNDPFQVNRALFCLAIDPTFSRGHCWIVCVQERFDSSTRSGPCALLDSSAESVFQLWPSLVGQTLRTPEYPRHHFKFLSASEAQKTYTESSIQVRSSDAPAFGCVCVFESNADWKIERFLRILKSEGSTPGARSQALKEIERLGPDAKSALLHLQGLMEMPGYTLGPLGDSLRKTIEQIRRG